jgi:hypothetical protein
LPSNEELLRELQDIKAEIRGIKEKRLDVNKLLVLLLNPKVLVSLGFVLAVLAFAGGRVAELSGFGLTLSASRANESAAEKVQTRKRENEAPALDFKTLDTYTPEETVLL